MRKLRSIGLLLVLGVTGALAASACSSASSGGTPGGGTGGGGAKDGGGSGGTAASGGTGASDGSSGTGAGGSGGLIIDGSGNDAPLNKDASCGDITQEATKIPLAMYIMLDESGSMSGSKWTAVTDGIKQFVQDQGSVGIKVAIQYFPKNYDCNGTGYDNPAVPMGVLPANAQAIINSLNSESPNGLTPTEGALNGLVKYCKSYATQNPKEKVIALLATDGDPTDCDTSQTTLDTIVGNGFSQSPSILTFTMGMQGATFSALDELAMAGGTGKAFDVSNGGAQAFLGALQSIAGSALGCDYDVPVSDGGKIDYSKVVVRWTSSSGQSTDLDEVSDQSKCGSTGGFYYDNPQTPTKISLCPTTCTTVQSDTGAGAKVEVLLGCALGPPA